MRTSLYLSCFKNLVLRPPPVTVFVNLLKYVANQRLLRRVAISYYPISLIIYLTKRCNYSCTFCYAQNVLDSKNWASDLTLDQLRKILASPYGRKALRIGFLGGEPFMNPRVFELIDEVKSHRKVMTLVTNASLLNEAKLTRLLQTRLDVLGVSLYENNRRHVERVVRTLDGKMTYWVQTVVTAQDLKTMESTLEFAVSIGCRHLLFGNCVPMTSEDRHLVIYDDNQEYLSLEARLKAQFRGKISVSWVQLVRRQSGKRACAMPSSYLMVDNDGGMGACCVRAPDSSRYGNIYSDANAWNLPYYLRLRESMLDPSIEPIDVCRDCDNLHQDLYRI